MTKRERRTFIRVYAALKELAEDAKASGRLYDYRARELRIKDALDLGRKLVGDQIRMVVATKTETK